MSETLTVHPLHTHFGARIDGADLSNLDDETFEAILGLYHQYGLLLFSDQVLAPADQVAFGKRFGIPSIPPRRQFNLNEHPEISLLGNIVNDDGTPLTFFNEMGVEWHSDSAGYENLDGVTFLYALKVPCVGGETMFCSMHAAWESLSKDTQNDLVGRRVLHSWNHHNDKVMQLSKGRPLTPGERAVRPDYWTELVQQHPVTGRTLYYVSHNLVKQIDDLTEAQSLEIVMPLVAHATTDKAVYTHQWKSRDLVIWDNRALMHSATEVETYRDDERLLRRSYSFTGPNALPGGKLSA